MPQPVANRWARMVSEPPASDGHPDSESPASATSPASRSAAGDAGAPVGSIAAIIPAAGSGSRFGSIQNKLFALLAGEPLWVHSVRRIRACPEVARVIMPISAADQEAFSTRYASLIQQFEVELIHGGAERTDSVQNGLAAVGDDSTIQLVAVHDAARPLVHQRDLQRVFAAAHRTGAALLATPATGTIKRSVANDDTDCVTVDRRDLWIALTPQTFKIELLQTAYQRYCGRPATDDAELVERCGHPVCLVAGRADNLKITVPEDLNIAEAILAATATG